MQYTLSETIEEDGPTAFTRKALSEHPNLFAERSALVFTPTDRLPSQFVGTGDLDVFLPICTPDWHDCFFIRSYMSPRLWLDLLQRHTGVLRWATFPHSTVTITRFDTAMIRQDHLTSGTKALLDALKIRTNGRSDGRPLFYFGAIFDDSERDILISWHQTLVTNPKETGMHITVSPTNIHQRPNHALQRTGAAVTPAASAAAFPPPRTGRAALRL